LVVARLHTPSDPQRAGAGPSIPAATPPGITLQLRILNGPARRTARPDIIVSDAADMPLYRHDKDAGSRSACTAECAQTWPAALAPLHATPTGDWTLRERADGTRQWVYRGSPLYRFAKDTEVGDATGDGAEDGAWHVAVFQPGAGMALPDAVAVREVADAGGAVLVSSSGMTLYASAERMHTPSCGGVDCLQWMPLAAPQIADSVGDFTVVARVDGIAQWAYRGRPLYQFAGDRNPGDVNGGGIDAQMDVALIERSFMPAGATIRRTVELGAILATRDRATLYQRDRVTSDELHVFRTDHGPPALGRAFGTASCDENCAQTWRPFAAPADARPCGYWDILTRANGTRQWAYKGFALYTYAADQPGEIKGNGIYDLQQIDVESGTAVGSVSRIGIDPNESVHVAGIGVGALFWRAVVP
jgi:predicted lipoprotein with Yx(FWY)xxD motif